MAFKAKMIELCEEKSLVAVAATFLECPKTTKPNISTIFVWSTV